MAAAPYPKPLTFDYMPEGYPRKSVQATTLMEGQELAFAPSGGAGPYVANLTNAFEIVIGQTYTVNWDGTVYECVCSVLDSTLAFGNLFIAGADNDTGEPFVYVYYTKQATGVFATLDTSASHTISVKTTAETVTPMAEEFLPSGVTAAIENAQTAAENAQTAANSARTAAENAQTTADAAQTAAENALANFPIKYSDVADTPLYASELPGGVTTYSRSSETEGTFINLILTTGIAELTGSGFYKISSDVFDFEDIFKIGYTFKYGSGNYSDLRSVDNLEQSVIFSSNPSVFIIDSNILFCGSTGTFEITVANVTRSFYVAETGIYSATNLLQGSSSFVNYLELTKKESVFIQSSKPVLIPSSTEGSTKKFKITVDDSGTISATEVT